MLLYKTIFKDGTYEQTIDKSKFIAHVAYVKNREEADEYIKNIKDIYSDATHNVPAFVIGKKQELMWASDDGEPTGTSGAPMLRVMEGLGLTNMVVVVTRYFGGIKLGTGGLVRAYTTSLQGAIDKLGISGVFELNKLTVKTDYSEFNKIQNYKFEDNVLIENIEYTDKISFDITMEENLKTNILDHIANLTGGKYEIIKEEYIEDRIKI